MKLAVLNGAPEVFYTIQGEGKSVGSPAVFCRLSLCNLHCVWCDTPYTWNWEGTPWPHDDSVKFSKFREIVELVPEAVAGEIVLTDVTECRHVVFTGGEPMLQQKELIEVMRILKSANPIYFFEVETNGTIAPLPELVELVDQFNVSPKLEGSGNKLSLRERPASYEALVRVPHAYFKFVITNNDDLVEVHALIEKYGIDKRQVYLMPEGRTKEDIDNKTEALVEICKQRGYNFSTRLHVLVWGAKKGV